MNTTAAIPIKHPERAVSNGILGMTFLLATETMLFAGFISSFIVNRSFIPVYPPPDQPRLPLEVTIVNTLILLASGVLYALYSRSYKQSKGNNHTKSYLLLSVLFGSSFLLIQGYEWIRMIGYGLSTTSNLFGAYFYTMIGAHALHVIAGISLLIYLFFFTRGNHSFHRMSDKITITGMYWYFVVVVWLVVFTLLYLY